MYISLKNGALLMCMNRITMPRGEKFPMSFILLEVWWRALESLLVKDLNCMFSLDERINCVLLVVYWSSDRQEMDVWARIYLSPTKKMFYSDGMWLSKESSGSRQAGPALWPTNGPYRLTRVNQGDVRPIARETKRRARVRPHCSPRWYLPSAYSALSQGESNLRLL